MIHDILISCLNIYSPDLPAEEFLVSHALQTFLHPAEKKILEDIINLINMHKHILKFTKIYGLDYDSSINSQITDPDEPIQAGLYLKAFANGISQALDSYLEEIANLERRYLQNASHSLLFIYQKLNVFGPLFLVLKNLIHGLRLEKLHGCAIIQYLVQNTQHGDIKICNAMKTIYASVNVVFLKQLTHWIVYAKMVDPYGEFFIQCSEFRNTTLESEKGTSVGSEKDTIASISEAASTYADIWRYEICYEYLPHYFSHNWAEKVLFIGQTVLLFKVDANNFNKNMDMWIKAEPMVLTNGSLWNGNEHSFFNMIQKLHSERIMNVSQYERVIDEIKSFVTTRLSEVAIKQADLVKQLKLIKDFYLLGRGELYLEFIRRTLSIEKETITENQMRDLVKAYESAAHSVGLSEDFDQFSLSVPELKENLEECSVFGYIQHVQLQYKINWPLHLLFSPKVINRYNTLFRFLLLIKKMQYELHLIWCNHTKERKLNEAQSVKIMHLRNQLMFFVDNLQYYIQVDVLESQFSILMNTIHNKADFEQIQRSHSIFQANVLSLCFLLLDEDPKLPNETESSAHSSNPVYTIINDIFHLCQEFCTLLLSKRSAERISTEISHLDERFGRLIEHLTTLLTGLKAQTATPLSQFLLHLDFNHWFSSQRKKL